MAIEIRDILSKTILSEAKGYLDIGFTHSLNPYSGCAFACRYCYVREMPIERKAMITRQLLGEMLETPPDLLQIQTRSPLITRDTDLLVQLKERCEVLISMTIETDRQGLGCRNCLKQTVYPIGTNGIFM